jgi:23S rRNA (cytosine1962-C5)-methyltransferase
MEDNEISRLEKLCETTLDARREWLGFKPGDNPLNPTGSGKPESRGGDPKGTQRPSGSFVNTEAVRLFNGFYEGLPELVVDLYGRSLVIYGYNEDQTDCQDLLNQAELTWRGQLPRVECVIQKMRSSTDPIKRRGVVSYGGPPDDQVCEQGVRYALDLLMNQDASLYLDTRPIRSWLLRNASGREMLNTFAYTGSLGVAALAGGAKRVVQVDRNRKFLSLARRSAMLNRLDLGRMKLLGGDFFSQMGDLKKRGELFDCVILDPPFFAESKKGRVDLVRENTRLINKVRPLVRDGGWLVVVNNALYLSGADFQAELEKLCLDGYLQIEEYLPIPNDVRGFADTAVNQPPVDPSPFNHPTKIAVMRVRRKA